MSQDVSPQVQLEQRRQQLKQALLELGDLRPGSLVARYRRCGKVNCHCAQPGAPGHGPSFSLTRRVDDKTVTRIIRTPSPGSAAPVEDERATRVGGRSSLPPCWGRCDCSVLTITVRIAAQAFVPETESWDWRTAPCRRPWYGWSGRPPRPSAFKKVVSYWTN